MERMGVELRLLDTFVAAAEEGHFGRAAKRLHMTQPTLSRQVRRLEEEIGVDLFDRGSRPIRLTATGTAFLEEAHLVLRQTRRAIERGRRAADGALGRLSVGLLPWTHSGTLPLVLLAFKRRVPDALLELSTGSPLEHIEALEKHRLDVCFVRAGIAGPGLQVKRLLEERIVAVVPAEHPFAARAEVSLNELLQQPFISIVREEVAGFQYAVATLLRERGLSLPKEAHEASDPQTQLALIAAGMGVGLHLAPVAGLCDRGVAFVALTGEVPTASLELAWRRGDGRESLQTFIETAHDVACSELSWGSAPPTGR